jgi:hypothetical protein
LITRVDFGSKPMASNSRGLSQNGCRDAFGAGISGRGRVACRGARTTRPRYLVVTRTIRGGGPCPNLPPDRVSLSKKYGLLACGQIETLLDIANRPWPSCWRSRVRARPLPPRNQRLNETAKNGMSDLRPAGWTFERVLFALRERCASSRGTSTTSKVRTIS